MQMHNFAQVTAQPNTTPAAKGLLVHFLTLLFYLQTTNTQFGGLRSGGRVDHARV